MCHKKVDLITSGIAAVLDMGYNSRLDVVGLCTDCKPIEDRSPKSSVNCKSLHCVTVRSEKLCSVDCVSIECIDVRMGSVESSCATEIHCFVIQYNLSTYTIAGHVENFRRGVG